MGNLGKAALIIGATGLVGSELLKQLLDSDEYTQVIIFVRRDTEITHPKLKQYILNFDQLESYQEQIKGDVLFSCLGTTIKAVGTKEAQYKVDFTYQNNMAKMAQENGVKTMVLVSSTSASTKSMFFYARMKGELEDSITKMGFEQLVILRPSVLIGTRPIKRSGEIFAGKLIQGLQNVFSGLRKYRGIRGDEVAKAMIKLERNAKNSVTLKELDQLFDYV